MTRRAIINADDFGLCRSVNEGIIEAHVSGILTSASLMVNMPGFDHAVELTRRHSKLGVGVHLNVIRGAPVAPPGRVAGLLSSHGTFLGSPYAVLKRLMSGKLCLAEIETEFRAQVEKALASGMAPDHLDSEKHVHALFPVFPAALKIAAEYNIRGIRLVNEFCLAGGPIPAFKALALAAAAPVLRRRLRTHGIMAAGRFRGLCVSGRMTRRRLEGILERLEGVCEIMVHPGRMTPELLALDRMTGCAYVRNHRRLELDALLDEGPRRILKRRGIGLATYGELGRLEGGMANRRAEEAGQ